MDKRCNDGRSQILRPADGRHDYDTLFNFLGELFLANTVVCEHITASVFSLCAISSEEVKVLSGFQIQ